VTEPPAGPGVIRLTVQNTLLGKPALSVSAQVDGVPVRIVHGENLIPVDAGRHLIEISTVLVSGSGDVSAEVDVPAHGQADLWYAPPYFRAIAGRLGDRPQQAAGTWFIVLVAAIIVVGMTYTLIR
jgi:hypothetical protein